MKRRNVCNVQVIAAAFLATLSASRVTLAQAKEGADAVADSPPAPAAEPVHIVVDAPQDCVTEADFLARVTALGGHWRVARPGEHARTFVVSIRRGGDPRAADAGGKPSSYEGRLTVKPWDGPESSRTFSSPRCDRVVSSLAFFASLAIDEDREALGDEPVATASPETSAVPQEQVAPSEDDKPKLRKRPRVVGSGGFAVEVGFVAGHRDPNVGYHAFGAVRAFGPTRLGAAVSFVHESSFGNTEAVGAMIGWGAPFNDVVAGFVGEAGVARFQGGSSGPKGDPYATPYASTELILQIRLPLPVRPFFSGATTIMPIAHESWVTGAARVGLVWRAW